jgi:hypothetical protein
MTTKEMIETLRYKANNIKAKIEPEFFNEVAEKLKMYQKENEVLKNRCKMLSEGLLCEFCPMECRYKDGGLDD